MRHEDRQYCAFMSFKYCLSSLAAAIFLEICGTVAFLHSLLMSAIVVSDIFADAIVVFCLRGNSLRLRYLRCCAVRLLGHLLSLLTSGTFNLLLTNLCPDAPCYVRRFLSKSEYRVSE